MLLHLKAISSYFLLSISIQVIQGQTAKVEFYGNIPPACVNSTRTVYESTDTLSLNPETANATSVSTIGLWKVFESRDVNPTGIIRTFYSSEASVECLQKSDEVSVWDKAQTYGDPVQAAEEIFFYTQKILKGVEFTANGTSELNLKKPIMMMSWLATGNHDWTVFQGVNFTGDSSCLTPNLENLNENGEGTTYSLDAKLIVGSVRAGCGDADSGSSAKAITFTQTICFNLVAAMLVFAKYY